MVSHLPLLQLYIAVKARNVCSIQTIGAKGDYSDYKSFKSI